MKTKQHTRLLSALTLATLFCTAAPFTGLFCAATAAVPARNEEEVFAVYLEGEKERYHKVEAELARLRKKDPEFLSDDHYALDASYETSLRLRALIDSEVKSFEDLCKKAQNEEQGQRKDLLDTLGDYARECGSRAAVSELACIFSEMTYYLSDESYAGSVLADIVHGDTVIGRAALDSLCNLLVEKRNNHELVSAACRYLSKAANKHLSQRGARGSKRAAHALHRFTGLESWGLSKEELMELASDKYLALIKCCNIAREWFRGMDGHDADECDECKKDEKK